ncbi:hypothetical protein CR513_59150, partial [Mucuna pruriens]
VMHWIKVLSTNYFSTLEDAGLDNDKFIDVIVTVALRQKLRFDKRPSLIPKRNLGQISQECNIIINQIECKMRVANSGSNSDFDPAKIAYDLEIDCDSDSADFDIVDFDMVMVPILILVLIYPHLVWIIWLTMTRPSRSRLMIYQPWCIRYLEWEQAQSYEHKSGLTHLLPKFHGLASNTQQFVIRGSPTYKVVNEVVVADNQRLENKIIELTSLVRQLAIGQYHSSPLVRECGMCIFVEHPTNACSILQEIEPQRYQPPPSFRPQQPMQRVQQISLEELVK